MGATFPAWGCIPSGGRTLRGGSTSAAVPLKIAGQRDLEMTGEYTFVTAERQNELTRRIQRTGCSRKQVTEGTTVTAPSAVIHEERELATSMIQ
jgi:hypothetical protein